MRVIFISILAAGISALFFLRPGSQESGNKGAYIISLESWQGGQRIFKFPNDSIFVCGDRTVQQVMRLDQFDFQGKVSLMQSVETYYLIDFNKGLFKDLGRDLEQKTEKIPWKDLREKRYGIDFRGDLHFSENFKIKDTVYEGKKIKKISYTAENREKYDILLEPFSSEEREPVFFDVIEPRFKGRVVKMTTSYPDGKGMVVYTTKYVPLSNHPVLDAMKNLR
jgi:hypothetical protein